MSKLAIAFAGMFTLIVITSPVHATFVINIQQSGNNVVATGSGSFNTAALTDTAPDNNYGTTVQPISGSLAIGINPPGDVWSGDTGPSNIGTSASQVNGTGAGGFAGIWGRNIVIENGYTSGTPYSDTGTWTNQTLSSLGITPGTYVWTWGTGATADSLTLNATPEPTSTLLMLGSGAMLLFRRRRAAV
jgi:hypothetical protein